MLLFTCSFHLGCIEVPNGLHERFVSFVLKITCVRWVALNESLIHGLHQFVQLLLVESGAICSAHIVHHHHEVITAELDVKVEFGEATEFGYQSLRGKCILLCNGKKIS